MTFHEIRDGMVIGRTEGSLTFPDDPLMSRKHLLFQQVEQEILVRDLETQNGTRINGLTLADRDSHILTVHDVIEAGKRVFIFTRQNQYRPQPRVPLTVEDESKTEVVRRTPDASNKRKWAKWVPVAVAILLIGFEIADYFAPTAAPGRKAPKKEALSAKSDTPLAQVFNIDDDWEAWNIDLASGAIYLRNIAIQSRKSTVKALAENPEMLARVLGGAAFSGTSAFLTQDPRTESVADRACDKLIDAGARWTPSPFKQVFDDLGSIGSPASVFGTDDEAFGPIPVALINARLSSIRYPWSESRFELASTLIHCAAPAGRRIAFANAFAAPFFAVRAKQALSHTLLKHEAIRLPSLTKAFQIESIKGVRLSTLIRASRNVEARLVAYQDWMKQSPDTAAALPAEMRQTFAQSAQALREANRAEMARLEADYENGRAKTPTGYPPIRPDATLAEGDLLFLRAY